MTPRDLAFVQVLLDRNVILDPVLELGGAYEGDTCAELVRRYGLRYSSTDMHDARGVDFIADFESGAGVEGIRRAKLFGSVLVLNVLEHTFDPIAVLDNALRLARPGGNIVAITPAVWPIHNYPVDCCRLLPDWYRRYASSRGLSLSSDMFYYVGFDRVDAYRTSEGLDILPAPSAGRPWHQLYSRAVHKIFNTFGRSMHSASHIAIGVVLVRA